MTTASRSAVEANDEVETLRYVAAMLTQLARISPISPRSPLAYLLDLAKLEVEAEIGRRSPDGPGPKSAPPGARSAGADDEGDAAV